VRLDEPVAAASVAAKLASEKAALPESKTSELIPAAAAAGVSARVFERVFGTSSRSTCGENENPKSRWPSACAGPVGP